jgi:hypothetical protein
VTCVVKRSKAPSVDCKVALPSGGPATLRWRLVRGKRTYRRGVARVRNRAATIRLGQIDRLARGRYMLELSGQPGATAIVLR